MGDTCEMNLTCRKEDEGRFLELGFVNEGSARGIFFMSDGEANFAHDSRMPKNIPYFGNSGEGEQYGPSRFACDGKEWAEITVTFDNDPCVRVNERGKPLCCDLRLVERYLKVLARARKALGLGRKFRWVD